MIQDILGYIDKNQKTLIRLLQQMIRIPSPTFHEGEMALVCKKELEAIKMDTHIDSLGNVTGVLRGSEDAPFFLMNTHLDHAEPGDMPEPYSAKIMDGKKFGDSGEVIYGRGVNGQKASLAGMIFAVRAFIDLGIQLKRGVAINAGIMEECGGHLGPKYFMEEENLPVYWVLSGEHTDLKPIIGHRGMINIQLSIGGIGSHAAAPEGSSSALTGAARVILALEKLKELLPEDKNLGKALVSLNRLNVSPNVANVIPDRVDAVVDARHPASLPREKIVKTIESCIEEAIQRQPGLKHNAGIRKYKVTSYTGKEEYADGCMYPFYTPPDHPLVQALIESIEEVQGYSPEPGIWTISSETGYFSTVSGLPVVAFGPGEDRFTHTRDEHVRTADVISASKVYAAMIARVCLNADL